MTWYKAFVFFDIFVGRFYSLSSIPSVGNVPSLVRKILQRRKGEIKELENQHRHITGYRELSREEIDLINVIKKYATGVGGIVFSLKADGVKPNSVDQRWLSIAETDLQKGFMSLVRSITKPESF
jgi:hypothetical protein